MSLVDQLANRAPQRGAAFAERNFPAEIYDCDVFDFTACALESHGGTSIVILRRLGASVAGNCFGKFLYHHQLGPASGRGVYVEFVHKRAHQEQPPA